MLKPLPPLDDDDNPLSTRAGVGGTPDRRAGMALAEQSSYDAGQPPMSLADQARDMAPARPTEVADTVGRLEAVNAAPSDTRLRRVGPAPMPSELIEPPIESEAATAITRPRLVKQGGIPTGRPFKPFTLSLSDPPMETEVETATAATPMGGYMTVPVRRTFRPVGPMATAQPLADRADEGLEDVDPSQGGKRPDSRNWWQRLAGGVGAAGLELLSGGGAGNAVISGIGGAQSSEYGSRMGRFGDFINQQREDYQDARQSEKQQRQLKAVETGARIEGIEAEAARDRAYAAGGGRDKTSWQVRIIKQGGKQVMVRVNPQTGEQEPMLNAAGQPTMWDDVKKDVRDRIVKLRNPDNSESVYLLGDDDSTLYPVKMPGGGQAVSAPEAVYGQVPIDTDADTHARLLAGGMNKDSIVESDEYLANKEAIIREAVQQWMEQESEADGSKFWSLPEGTRNAWIEAIAKRHGYSMWAKLGDTIRYKDKFNVFRAEENKKKGQKVRLNPTGSTTQAGGDTFEREYRAIEAEFRNALAAAKTDADREAARARMRRRVDDLNTRAGK
jgi:hypothetical protein